MHIPPSFCRFDFPAFVCVCTAEFSGLTNGAKPRWGWGEREAMDGKTWEGEGGVQKWLRLCRPALLDGLVHPSEPLSRIVHESVDQSGGGCVQCRVFPALIKYLPAVRARRLG